MWGRLICLRRRARRATPGDVLPVVGPLLNLVLPGIAGVRVVGEVLAVSAGIWSLPGLSYAYAWTRDGAPIAGAAASTYIVQDADAANGVGGIRCVVTASIGPISVIAATAMSACRRTYPTLAYPFGRLTRQGMGGVNLADIPGLLGVDAAPVTGWAKNAFDANDGHWNRDVAGVTPVPLNHGTATAASYTATLDAAFEDGKVEPIALTIETRANTFTLSNRDNWQTFYLGLGGNNTARNTALSLRTIELPVGAKFENGYWDMNGWKPDARLTVRSADPDRRPVICHIRVLDSQRIDLRQIATGGPVLNASQAYGRIVIANGCDDITIQDVRHFTSMDYIRANTGNLNGFTFCSINGADNVVIDGVVADGVMNFVSADADTPHRGLVVQNFHVQNIFSNGAIVGTYKYQLTGGLPDPTKPNPNVGLWSATFRNGLFFRFRRFFRSIDHNDGFQLQQETHGGRLTIENVIVHEWDGDASVQGLWYGAGFEDVSDPPLIEVDGFGYFGRYGNAIGLSAAALGSYIRRYLLAKAKTLAIYGFPPLEATGQQDIDQPNAYGPWFRFSNVPSNYHGLTISRGVTFDNPHTPFNANITATDGVIDWNSNPLVDGNLPPDALPGGPYAGALAADPFAVEALAIADPDATPQEIMAAIMLAWRPQDGGPLERPDGSFNYPFNPNGGWATGAAYAP